MYPEEQESYDIVKRNWSLKIIPLISYYFQGLPTGTSYIAMVILSLSVVLICTND